MKGACATPNKKEKKDSRVYSYYYYYHCIFKIVIAINIIIIMPLLAGKGAVSFAFVCPSVRHIHIE